MVLKALKRFVPWSDINAFGISFPSQHEAKWLTQSVERSPDLGWLEQQEFQLLFSPDDTRVGYDRYGLVEDGVHLCTGYTKDTFAYWLQETTLPNGLPERIPIPMRQDGERILRYTPPSLKIKGEVHAIRPWQFQRLDDYKRNREQFRRQRVNILIPFHVESRGNVDDQGREIPKALQDKGHLIVYPDRVYVLRCWMYIGIPEYWDVLLDAGFRGFKTVNHYESRKKRPWLKEYYDFPKHPL